jgi:hypothetical protein
VITEVIIYALSSLARLIDTLMPTIPWPEWLATPREWFTDMVSGGGMTGVFGLVHPLVYDVALLALSLSAAKAVISRVRQVMSVATGGGMNSGVKA